MPCPRIVFFVILLLTTPIVADTLLVPDDYDTIQEAIDAAEDEDAILVAPDLYVENLDF